MIIAVVLAIVSEAALGVSVWGFIASLQQGSWQCAIAAVCAFVAADLMLFLSYYFVYGAGMAAQREKMWNKAVNRRVLTLKPGQSMAFRLVPGEDSYVTVRPEPDQWATTRIDPVHEGMRTNGHG